MSNIQLSIKRGCDFCVALCALILFLPVFIVLCILIRIKLGSPVFFTQKRPGLNGKPFYIIKFRTMTNTKDDKGILLPDQERLNSMGQFIRSTSLDELPEIINVLKGDMSWVGPRPLMWKYLNRYTPHQARRHEVKPGITGWAQINGRNVISWEDKFNYDVWYVGNWSLWLDLRVFLRTFVEVCQRRNINQENKATVDEFFGTEKIDKVTVSEKFDE